MAPTPPSRSFLTRLLGALNAGDSEKVTQLLATKKDVKPMTEAHVLAALAHAPPALWAQVWAATPDEVGGTTAVHLLQTSAWGQAQPLLDHYGLAFILGQAIGMKATNVVNTLLDQGVYASSHPSRSRLPMYHARTQKDHALLGRLIDNAPDQHLVDQLEAVSDLARFNDGSRLRRLQAHVPLQEWQAHVKFALREAAAHRHTALFEELLPQCPQEARRETMTLAMISAIRNDDETFLARVLPEAKLNDPYSNPLELAAHRNYAPVLALLAPVCDFRKARKLLTAQRKWKEVNVLALWAPADIQDEWLKEPQLAPALAAQRAQQATQVVPSPVGPRRRMRS